ARGRDRVQGMELLVSTCVDAVSMHLQNQSHSHKKHRPLRLSSPDIQAVVGGGALDMLLSLLATFVSEGDIKGSPKLRSACFDCMRALCVTSQDARDGLLSLGVLEALRRYLELAKTQMNREIATGRKARALPVTLPLFIAALCSSAPREYKEEAISVLLPLLLSFLASFLKQRSAETPLCLHCIAHVAGGSANGVSRLLDASTLLSKAVGFSNVRPQSAAAHRTHQDRVRQTTKEVHLSPTSQALCVFVQTSPTLCGLSLPPPSPASVSSSLSAQYTLTRQYAAELVVRLGIEVGREGGDMEPLGKGKLYFRAVLLLEDTKPSLAEVGKETVRQRTRG
ncbi:hypothetical protein KIPB_010151, partial [Kipferlia bialata]